MSGLHEWAEQILFGCDIADKLVAPSSNTDTSTRPAISVPKGPGRPYHLEMTARPRVSFPTLTQLENEASRGHALHFFANHELLALELMALMLLRFPDAPQRFRKSIAVTMRDEQRHLLMYLERMGQLGVELGEIPVNDFFWRVLSGVDSPKAFVAGMALTFEQANLDFSLEFQRAFDLVGDVDTAALMERVYIDEIRHVSSGLQWMRKWKDPKQTDWQAHCAYLTPPLSLARARGKVFSIDARRRAGFGKEYIDKLEVFEHTKGRPPTVWWFNPGCEDEIVRSGDALPATALTLQRDLDLLVMHLAAKDDVVLSERQPRVEHLKSLKDAGFTLPEVVKFKGDLLDHPFKSRSVGKLSPWGWSPTSARLLQPLGAPPWRVERSHWHGKSLGAVVLGALMSENTEPWWCNRSAVGRSCGDVNMVVSTIGDLRSDGFDDVVIKAEYGASGRGSRRLLAGESIDVRTRSWLRRVLSNQSRVVVEPWLDRVMDLSFHFDKGPNGVKYQGCIRFFTDARGQYLGHWLGEVVGQAPREMVDLLTGHGREPKRLPRLAARLGKQLNDALGEYEGPVGVDALAYRCPTSGSLHLKPVVEINPRWSMGRIGLALTRRVRTKIPAVFVIMGRPGLSALGLTNPKELENWVTEHPLSIDGQGRFESGTMCLTDPRTAQLTVALMAFGESAVTLCRAGVLGPIAEIR